MNSDSLRRELFEAHQGWAQNATLKFCQNHNVFQGYWEDCTQEGLIAMWRCAATFDESRNVTFRGYAYGRMVGAVKDLLRASSVVKGPRMAAEQLGFTSLSIEDQVLGFGRPVVRSELLCYENDVEPETVASRNELATIIVRSLRARERDVILRICRGETLLTVGRELGISEERAGQLYMDGIRYARSMFGLSGPVPKRRSNASSPRNSWTPTVPGHVYRLHST